MSVIEASRSTWSEADAVRGVIVDLRLLRSWESPAGCAAAALELDRVRQSLAAEGLASRSAERIASALARYAFLTDGGCNPSRRALWRMHAVDGIPADVLAQLAWAQIRIRLREIAVTGASSTRYFALSDQTCRLLMAARNDRSETRGSAPVFVLEGGQAWHPESLAQVLAAISVR